MITPGCHNTRGQFRRLQQKDGDGYGAGGLPGLWGQRPALTVAARKEELRTWSKAAFVSAVLHSCVYFSHCHISTTGVTYKIDSCYLQGHKDHIYSYKHQLSWVYIMCGVWHRRIFLCELSRHRLIRWLQQKDDTCLFPQKKDDTGLSAPGPTS
jgi:hypothetical protein